VRITGVAAQVWVLERSTDFSGWSTLSTVTLPLSGIADVALGGQAGLRTFYRARSL